MNPTTMLARAACAMGLGLALAGCAAPFQPVTERNSPLTQGNVQMNVLVGQTTKADVLETFGAPNVTTRDGDGNEVWSYQRAARVTQSSSQSGLWSIILAPGGRGVGGGVGSSSSTGFETTSRMMTLIIEFGADDVVEDFRSRAANF
ncbi:MAG: hypothetical protein OXI12_04525 [Gammaproteobacteria bacterium]|nr:hypothetical protein [Rhodospirillaceae bacterium]MDE0649591.1 hypothetical protein [Gammaproteobacteria bacterium]